MKKVIVSIVLCIICCSLNATTYKYLYATKGKSLATMEYLGSNPTMNISDYDHGITFVLNNYIVALHNGYITENKEGVMSVVAQNYKDGAIVNLVLSEHFVLIMTVNAWYALTDLPKEYW